MEYPAALETAASQLISRVESKEPAPDEFAFPHVRITDAAFPADTEAAIARARQFISDTDDRAIRTLLNLACMTILEDVSYTRKDGQYLRWDHRSGRALRTRVNKGPILSFQHALGARLFEMVQDVDILKQEYGEFMQARVWSCCESCRMRDLTW